LENNTLCEKKCKFTFFLVVTMETCATTVTAPFCGAGSGAPEARVILKKWNAVALWTYDVGQADNCAICLNSLVERCIDCTVDDCAEELCVKVWGMCSK
jgi:hypothetical protein